MMGAGSLRGPIEPFDAIVVLGARGSAALACRGERVLGLEQFGRGETFRSSPGRRRRAPARAPT
jgi:hypothetical protein